jgi:xanthosine utilization system XapX-like protein
MMALLFIIAVLLFVIAAKVAPGWTWLLVIIVIVALIARIQVPTTTALLFALSLVIGTTIAQFGLAALWGAWFNRANAPDVVGHVDERLRAIFWAKIANKIVSTRSQRCSPIP